MYKMVVVLIDKVEKFTDLTIHELQDKIDYFTTKPDVKCINYEKVSG